MKLMILTTNRADWGHLSIIAEEMKNAFGSNVLICAGGGHFDMSRGYTADQIGKSGIKPDFVIKLPFAWKTSAGLSRFLISFQKRLRTLIKANNVKYVMVLGDRIELLPLVNISIIDNLRIIHISGGETTRGAVDDKIRHMLSVNAEIIFTGSDVFSNELKKKGIDGEIIINAGDPGLQVIARADIPSLASLNTRFRTKLIEGQYILMTFHPETNTGLSIEKQFEGIAQFLLNTSITVLCTAPNGDRGGDYILSAIKHICRERSNVIYIPHLGEHYHTAVKHSSLVMGNSSSIVIDVPFMKKQGLLIGSRQEGRPLHSSTVTCSHQYGDIKSAVNDLIKNKRAWDNTPLVYDYRDSAGIIVSTLKKRLPDLSL